MTKQIVIHGLERIVSKLDKSLIEKPLKDFFNSIGVVVQGRARQNAPVDTGHLRNSIQYETDKSVPALWAKVGLTRAAPGTPLWFKARAMEYGTGKQGDGEVSHESKHWPPGAALDTWARRHGFESGYQVAAAIGRRGGLKPRRYLRDAIEQSMGDIKGLLDDLGHAIFRNWEK